MDRVVSTRPRGGAAVALLTVLIAAATFAAQLAAPPSATAANEQTTLILHAIPHAIDNRCSTPYDQGFDCGEDGRPTVDVIAFSEIDVYLYVRNFDSLSGVQCAFAWPIEWTFQAWGPLVEGGCQSQQVFGIQPQGAGGATDGTLTTAFDCVTGGFLTAIGSMWFTVGNAGCLSIVDSTYPYGTHVIGCDLTPATVHPDAWGAICVNEGGLDTCDPNQPVVPATWGRIKAAYQRR
jgi:hypothetical protein